MKIKNVDFNNRSKSFSVVTAKNRYEFPYSNADPLPVRGNYVQKVFVDKELGSEGFTYALASGEEGSVHIDHVLEYNQDPEYMVKLLSYNLSIALQKCFEKSKKSKREITRRLNTSPTQLYRLLNPSTSKKSIAQKLTVLQLLDCDVELKIKDRNGKKLVECIA